MISVAVGAYLLIKGGLDFCAVPSIASPGHPAGASLSATPTSTSGPQRARRSWQISHGGKTRSLSRSSLQLTQMEATTLRSFGVFLGERAYLRTETGSRADVHEPDARHHPSVVETDRGRGLPASVKLSDASKFGLSVCAVTA